MEVSMFSSRKANKNAEKMEKLTTEMHSIAEITRAETVSMGIITWLTLLFLPGTFISVSSMTT
jgi:Mg2+ and Co2+ transporter CorA